MKILVGIYHPAHVHFFKHFIWEMEKNAHEVVIMARNKDVTLSLLVSYGFTFKTITSHKKSILGKVLNYFIRWIQTYKLCKEVNPDILLGIADFYSAQIGRILRRTSIVFTDSEHVKIDPILTFPFADIILTPNCFSSNVSDKQIRYNGYHELAYLYPNYYNPDLNVLDIMGLKKEEKFIILRFVSWDASHDIGHPGLTLDMKRKVVKELSKYVKVFISSEGELSEDLVQYQIQISPEKIHDVLYFATLYIGEGATLASECAMLGTPAIYINTLEVGYCKEQEEKYSLVYNFRDFDGVIKKAKDLLDNQLLNNQHQENRFKMISDKIDVTAFMVWFVENYPKSFKKMKVNSEYQNNFK